MQSHNPKRGHISLDAHTRSLALVKLNVITYIYIYICRGMFSGGGCAAATGSYMRSISSGLAGGSSLALAWKALSVLDRSPPDPVAICEALRPATSGFCWFSFCLGLICGVLVFAFVELVVTLRWLLVSLSERGGSGWTEARPARGRPLYKIL